MSDEVQGGAKLPKNSGDERLQQIEQRLAEIERTADEQPATGRETKWLVKQLRDAQALNARIGDLQASEAELVAEPLRRQLRDARAELAAERAKVQRVEKLAEFFQGRLPDGTGNGRAYNSYKVAEFIRAALTGEESERPKPVIEHPRDAKGSTRELGCNCYTELDYGGCAVHDGEVSE